MTAQNINTRYSCETCEAADKLKMLINAHHV
jgi:hypothetical protein